MADQDNHHEITFETLRTPPLEIKSAPLARRAGAALIDSVIVGFSWLIVVHFTQLSLSVSFGSWIILFLISFPYYSTAEGVFSATLGKHVLQLRVVGSNGDPCTLGESVIRNLFRPVDWLPACYVLGVVVLSITDRKLRVGDRIAHTVVTVSPERDQNPPPAPFLFH